MTAEAKRNPLEVFYAGQWTKAVFTTFTLHLTYFESHVLPRLARAGCRDISIFVDHRFYIASLNESAAQHAGSGYRVIPARMPSGSFHAKLTYLHGNDRDALLVGSGNLTESGFGRNLECLDVLESQTDGAAVAQYSALLRRSERGNCLIPRAGQAVLRTVMKRATDVGLSKTVASRAQSPRLLHSLDESIGAQIGRLLKGEGQLRRIIAMSPHLDAEAGALCRLAFQFDCGEVQIAVEPRDRTTPVGQHVG